jgi:antitoxin component YwqK of YwqJK toxin-antitoxin module
MRRVTLSELEYRDDGLYHLDGAVFTGTIVLIAKDGSGREKGFMECRDGLRWGASREAYPDGSPMVEATHFKGVLHGRAREWHRNGVLAEDGEYEYGLALWVKEWDETGQLVTARQMQEGDSAHARLLAARTLYGASGTSAS